MKPKSNLFIHTFLKFQNLARVVTLTFGLALASSMQSAHAQATWVGDTSQDWNTAGNWSSDPANPTGNFTINTDTVGVYPILDAASVFTPTDLLIADGGTNVGRFDHRTGSLALLNTTATGNWMFVARGANTAVATYNLAETSTVGGGVSGFAQGDGGLTVGKLFVGGGYYANGGSGAVNINTSGTITANSTQNFSGQGNAAVVVGCGIGASGTINLENGTVATAGEVWLGNLGSGVVNQTGGIVNVNSLLLLSRNNNNTQAGTGTWSVSGTGVVNVENDLVVSFAGNSSAQGTLNINAGGAVNVATNTYRWMIVNQWDTANGTVNINGGTLNLNANTDLRFSSGNSTGAGVVNLNSGAITFWSGNGTGAATEGDIDLMASNVAGNNTFNLNGGTLNVRSVYTTSDNGIAMFNFNGGILKAGGNNAVENNFVRLEGANQKVNVRAGGAFIDSNGHDVVISDALLEDSGSTGGGLNKAGAGKLTLRGANTYTGTTTVNGGSLVFNNASNTIGTVVVNNGSIDSNGTINSLTVADVVTNNLSAGASASGSMIANSVVFLGDAQISLRADGGYMDQSIFVETALTTTPANGVVSVNVTNTSGIWTADPTGWDYTIISHNGTYAGDAATDFAVGTLTPALGAGQTATIIDTGTEIVLRITGDPLAWTGSVSADWNTTQNNWITTATGPTNYTDGQAVLFEDGANFLNVNLAADVAPGTITFDNFVNDYTISSTGGFGITGAASVILNGGGQVTIETDNSYTGHTNISSGTLTVSGSGSIASGSSIILGNSGELILDLSGNDEYANPITGTGIGATKKGSGTLTLSGNSSFTGNFSLDAGQLNLNSAGALGAGPGIVTLNSGILDNTSGGTINMGPDKPQAWNTDITFLGSNDLFMSNGAVTINASRTVNVQAGIFGVGEIIDNGLGYNMVKTGAGTLVLNGGNIAGNVDIQSGIVGINQNFFGGAPIGTGILQNAGDVGTRWTHWNNTTDVTTGLLIRNNDGSHDFQLGFIKRGPNTLTLTNGANNITSALNVDQGKLVLNAGTYGARNDDGSTNANQISIVGWDAGADAVLEINGATVNFNNHAAGTEPWRATLVVGNAGTGAAAVKLTTGSLGTNKALFLGNASSYGAMSQTGGTSALGAFLILGDVNSNGILNCSGGVINHSGPVTIGALQANGRGVVNLSGTAAYNYNNTQGFGFWIGEGGDGTLNVSGSAALTLTAGGGVVLGQLAGGDGVLNLLGGAVTTPSVAKGAGTGRLNFNGGTLAANAASATFLQGLTSAYVRPGGGTIHNGGNAITIGQPLLAPTGNGVAIGTLSATGAGFIDTPLVIIAGDGAGATAVANIDGSGNLTGITITNPGTGYTTPPAFALVGGGTGNNGAITGTAALAANVSGGLTYSGAAITTLNAVNTYTGNTTINSGTTVVVANGGALTVKPTTNGVSSKVTGAGTVSFDGALRVDLSTASVANGNSWTLVDATTKVFNLVTFKVSNAGLGDFTALGDGVTHQLLDGNKTWTFSETTGVLSLSVTSSGFASWIGGFGLGLADQDPLDDPDNDGVKNIVEYVLGRNPALSDGAASSASGTATDLLLTFQRSDLAVSNADVAISIEYGSNLTGWTEVAVPAASSTVGGVTFTITDGTPNDTVVASIPHGGATKFFGRVKAVK